VEQLCLLDAVMYAGQNMQLYIILLYFLFCSWHWKRWFRSIPNN